MASMEEDRAAFPPPQTHEGIQVDLAIQRLTSDSEYTATDGMLRMIAGGGLFLLGALFASFSKEGGVTSTDIVDLAPVLIGLASFFSGLEKRLLDAEWKKKDAEKLRNRYASLLAPRPTDDRQ